MYRDYNRHKEECLKHYYRNREAYRIYRQFYYIEHRATMLPENSRYGKTKRGLQVNLKAVTKYYNKNRDKVLQRKRNRYLRNKIFNMFKENKKE